VVVASTFNGMGCIWIALEKLGIIVDTGYSSEIDKYANIINDKNYPNVIQLGDICNIGAKDMKPVDLLVGGSPCQNLSMAVINNIKHNQGLSGDKSKLFYEFLRLKQELKPTYFLLENVGGMTNENKDMISYALGVEPVRINSNLFSAQDRDRYYWTNIEIPELPETSGVVLRDIVEPADKVPAKYWYDVPFTYNGDDAKVQATLHINGHDILKRVYNLNGKCGTLTKVSGGSQQKKVFQDGRCRKLMPVEYERLQNVPDGYTSGVSDGQRYNMLGNGWTVDVIKHILSGMLVY
jgi:DNA (cytosine-5)-methyltransferase 3A